MSLPRRPLEKRTEVERRQAREGGGKYGQETKVRKRIEWEENNLWELARGKESHHPERAMLRSHGPMKTRRDLKGFPGLVDKLRVEAKFIAATWRCASAESRRIDTLDMWDPRDTATKMRSSPRVREVRCAEKEGQGNLIGRCRSREDHASIRSPFCQIKKVLHHAHVER